MDEQQERKSRLLLLEEPSGLPLPIEAPLAIELDDEERCPGAGERHATLRLEEARSAE